MDEKNHLTMSWTSSNDSLKGILCVDIDHPSLRMDQLKTDRGKNDII